MEFVKNAKIALVNAALEVKKTEVDARIQIQDPTQLQAFLDEEETMLRKMVQKISKTGANVLICQKGIDDIVQYLLANEGIYAVRRASEGDLKKLAKATGAKIVSNINYHRAQHGWKINLSAPERSHRNPGSMWILRAGRESDHWHL